MKAVVLAGGYATRMWPITKHRPKMFLPIGDSTVVDRIFTELEEDDRIDDVYVSTNERFAPDFESHLAEREFEKPQLSIEETTDEDEKFGVVGALAQLIDREGVDDDLLVIAGDNLISFDVTDFLDYFDQQDAPTLAAYDVGSREKAKSYGLVELEGDRVVDFQEKPDDPRSTLVSIACYAFPEDALSLLPTYLEEGNNPDEPGWFVQWLQSREPTYAYTFEGAWFDIGTPESYLDAVSWHLDGNSLVAESATLENATVGDNVHVMDGVTLEDTHLEHTVVFPGATVRNGDIRRSIIDQGTHLEDLDLAGALIGAHTTIRNGSSE
ncbi:sugar phosphate nucleotidyltransferase [Natronobacterium gregoryi]|uniref:Glucose-1-phosphate thymidylyltransferase n=2 Tax=Natronobacterium gregoryi TaxID=44930 RepID=L0AFE5_NATGS|nr:NDP-sugar synthase [Natronobacterium gregoryi]AFZ72149.1 Nucleoside-diphosphate-sugar pyrophosphorylase family protein [Natronobacterium gregoryi SP2]ELY62887.1 Nucleotidyl transferase [Natronobacterium gregoryi SP2]PLK20096.1 glucose-1-phosphate thymidylyltransferase [Natronobacterium gregoryi SP2]SFJ33350.1 glucose-1-phosphate thymidylyltransferase [Natronobacterium gregoryi]